MRAGVAFPERIELSILCPENRLRVENHANSVVVRTARPDVSPSQKTAFIHYLAAEGYIPERYQWFTDFEAHLSADVQWLVDDSSAKNPPFVHGHPLPQIIRAIVYAGLFWLTLITMAISHAPP